MIFTRPLLFYIVLALLILIPAGCAQDLKPADFSGRTPVVRVLIAQGQTAITLAVSQPPIVQTGNSSSSFRLDLPPNTPAILSLSPTGWRLGNIVFGTGELDLQPASEGSVSINKTRYRGRFRLVPNISTGKFDVVNDLDVEGYLKGVVPREALSGWDEETFKAQAVVARTYAIYELKAAGSNSAYDLYSDQRSQVYGGIDAETAKSRQAVDDTTGMVVTSGAAGQEKIFKAYFSSCCGGIGQSAADAFGDPYNSALVEQSVGTLCAESPKYSWPEFTLTKAELTQRFRHFGAQRDRAEKNMAMVSRLEVATMNRLGRPVRFVCVDAKGARYTWTGEEFRWAVDTDATSTTKLYSSLVQIDNQPNAVRFYNGHGIGHGVGMCQWCAQARAERGMKYDSIVTTSYPGSQLLKAY